MFIQFLQDNWTAIKKSLAILIPISILFFWFKSMGEKDIIKEELDETERSISD